jgi:hypothetical protein
MMAFLDLICGPIFIISDVSEIGLSVLSERAPLSWAQSIKLVCFSESGDTMIDNVQEISYFINII